MLYLWIFTSFVSASTALDGYCHNDVTMACKHSGWTEIENCNAKNNEIDFLEYDLQSFVNKHITHSFQYLLLSAHFNNYETNREGFTKLHRKLSDDAWNEGINLIKYITKRGGKMDFGNYRPVDTLVQRAINNQDHYELYELESLAKALDIQKSIAEEANRIHLKAVKDSEAMSHFENNIVHKLSSQIRELSGHANDLKNLISSSKHSSLFLHLFDSYLQKLY